MYLFIRLFHNFILYFTGSRLITGGGVIQIWHLEHEQLDEHGGKSVKFSVGDHEDEGAKLHYYNHDEDLHPVWDCVWRIK